MEPVMFDCAFCKEDKPMSQYNIIETKWGTREWVCDYCVTNDQGEDILNVIE